MRKLLKYLVYPCLGAIMLTSCVKDGENADECESYVEFVYDYNMSFINLFHKQVNKIDLFIFDSQGNLFLQVISEEAPSDTFHEGYRIKLPRGLPSDVQFIAWSGLCDDLIVPDMTETTTMTDLIIALKALEDDELCSSLTPLWYGSCSNPKPLAYRNEVNKIEMIKNTNHIRIVLQSLEDDLELDVDQFGFNFNAVNGSYNEKNEVCDQIQRRYVPFYAENYAAMDTYASTRLSNSAAVVEISTLRLMEDNYNHLRVYDKTAPSEPLLDINLNNYINALKLNSYKDMPLQEYMDREDEYKIVLFVRKNTQPAGPRYISAYMSINDWIVRDQIDDLENK